MMAGGKLEIIIPMWWALRVSRGNIVKANASSQMMLAMLASTNNTDFFDLWSCDTDLVQQLTSYFILLSWSGVCVAGGAVPVERGCLKTNARALRRVCRALWTHLIQSEPLVLSTHQPGVYYLGPIKWTCLITQCVVELVTQGSKVPLKKAPTITLHSVLLLSAFIRPALLLLLHCAWLLQSRPINTTL